MNNVFWALIVLFLVATFFRLDWIYYLVYVVGGVWVFSHWWIRRSLNHVSVQRNVARRAFAGETVTGTVVLQNQSWLPLPWLRLRERVATEIRDVSDYDVVLSLGSRARATHEYTLACRQRGYHALGPLQLSTGDLFGFASAAWSEMEPLRITVYPQLFTLPELGLPSRMPFGALASRQPLFVDPARVSGVRDYVSGDSLRAVHWKASARESTLQVKKFQPAIALNVALVLDLNRDAFPVRSVVGSSEWAISVAASLASYVTNERQPVGLLCNGFDPASDSFGTRLPTRNGQAHLMQILEYLARVQVRAFEGDLDLSLATWLPARLADLDWGTTLMVVTPHLDESTLWTLHQARRRGASVLVLICAPMRDLAAVQSRASALGVSVYATQWERDFQQMAEG